MKTFVYIACCLVISIPCISGCNFSGYRGVQYDTWVYDQTYFDLDNYIAHFPENLNGKYNFVGGCNNNLMGYKEPEILGDYIKFPPAMFDSCKKQTVTLSFVSKKNINTSYEFTIYAADWDNQEKRKKAGLIYGSHPF